MPIDPRIPLSVEPVSFANKPFEGLRTVLGVQEAQGKLRALRQAEQDALAVRQILAESDGDWYRALPKLRQVAPMASIEIEKALGEMRGKVADGMIKEFEREEQVESDTLSMLKFLGQNPTLYGDLLPTLQQRAPKVPAQMWPQADAPDLQQQLDRLAQINITVVDQAKQNQENVRALLKGDFKAVERALATADDEGDWNAALEAADFILQLPRGTTAQQYGPFAPEKRAALQKGETGGAFTLTPGSVRFDAQGKEIASVPASAGTGGGFTLSPGAVRYDAQGNVIASRPPSPTGAGGPRVPVVIQGPNGPLLLNRDERTTQPIMGPDGQPLGAAPTADMRNRAVARELVAKSINALEQLGAPIFTHIGPAQRADAIKRGAMAVFGHDPTFRTYQDARMALAGNLAVAQQGSKPSDADIQAIWLPLVPDPYADTRESWKLKWDLIRTMSNVSAPNAPSASGAPGGISYQDYLRKRRGGQ